jgi:tRNA(fMet)-specific endonuclease VapC
MMISGHARATGMILVTNNEKEFAQVQGLLVENWCAE